MAQLEEEASQAEAKKRFRPRAKKEQPKKSEKESRFGDPVGPEGTKPAAAGDASSENDGAVSAEMRKAMLEAADGAVSRHFSVIFWAHFRDYLAISRHSWADKKRVTGEPMLATLRKYGKVVHEFSTAEDTQGKPKLEDSIRAMLTKLGAPEFAVEASAVHAAVWYGVQTAKDLKEAAPLLCGTEEQIQEEDCQEPVANLVGDGNGAHMIEGKITSKPPVACHF